MSHPGARKIVDDDEEDVELTGTQIGIADDAEIRANHDLQEKDTLIGGVRVMKKKSCLHSTCRILLGIVATAVFTFMLIQLWANYGDTIKARVFSPQVIGAGTFDTDGEAGKLFGVNFLKWDNSTLHLNITKPEHELLQVSFHEPQAWDYTWKDDLLTLQLSKKDFVTVMAWSI